jgi:hypothetical protein
MGTRLAQAANRRFEGSILVPGTPAFFAGPTRQQHN